MSNHTQGPWKTLLEPKTNATQGHPATHDYYVLTGEERAPEYWIAQVFSDNFARAKGRHPDEPTGTANARLIAAAPELLEACEALLYALNNETPVGTRREEKRLAITAITKAKG